MPRLPQPFLVIRLVAVLSLIFFAVGTRPNYAQESSVEVSVGIGGIAKLGHWVPVRFKFSDAEIAKSAVEFRITALDGDDTPVTIKGPLFPCGKSGSNEAQGVVQFGRTYGDATFEVLDSAGAVLAGAEFVIRKQGNKFAELIPSTSRLYVCLEPSSEGDSSSLATMFAASFPGGIGDDDKLVSLNSLTELPKVGVAFESCESLMLSTSDARWLGEFPTESLAAIESWVRNGGHLVIAGSSENAADFEADHRLSHLFPGKVVGTAELDSSRRLEEFCNSKDPYLDRRSTMRVLKLEQVDGLVVLAQNDTPLIIRRAIGFGEVTFLTFDPSSQRFRDWSGSGRFTQNLMKLRLASEGSSVQNDTRAGSAVRHSGYDDLVGQLKVPLERFTKLRFIPFALIAALIALYILCIGLGDWFLVGRLFKKHELTWITFPILAAIFCGIAWFAAKSSRPAEVQLNQVELIDIDTVSKQVRATAWSVLYSPQGATVDLSSGVVDGEETKLNVEADSARLSWLGLPGDGLGGMLNRANPGLYRTGYQQNISLAEGDPANVDVALDAVELQVSSTRPLMLRWNGTFQGRVNSRLEFTDRLEGTFTNPLDVRLTNCKLYCDGLVYIVHKLDAGETIDIFSDTEEKTVRNFLTRKTRSVDDKNKSQSLAWNTRDRNVSRILDMMMFYQGSGGRSYTNLTHAYHDFIEMTPNASMNRAILVGQLKDRVSSIEIDGEGAGEKYDSSLSIVRILLPVERKKD